MSTSKILIIGDYSSLGLNLKKGLIKNGSEVTLISTGDGWKNLLVDLNEDILIRSKNIKVFNYEIKGTGRLKISLFILSLHLGKWKKLYNKYDIIIVMNQVFATKQKLFNGVFYVPQNVIKKLLKKEGKIYCLACGDDSYYLKSLPFYRYAPYSEEERVILNEKFNKISYDALLKQCSGVIPTCWDYAEAYRMFYEDKKAIKKTIQFPLDLLDIEYKPNLIKDKIIIFHGLNREGFKGTEYIKIAMENIKKKYPDKVEIIIDGKMPLEEYKKILEKSNIVIDQCKSYSYGMNALISMAQGKLVFSGNEKECMDELKRKDIPVINIVPSVKDIEEKLEYFIKNPHLITEIGEKSRKFVEEFHESSMVAKIYLEIMKN